MKMETGTILPGKVTGITKFGAFVTVAPGKSGLVHISEIANTYVNDIHEFLTEGQEVNVKIINIDDSGRLNLSIKAALPAPAPRREEPRAQHSYSGGNRNNSSAQAPVQRQQYQARPAQPSADSSFEDKLKRFMQDSDNKIAGVRQYSERKTSRRRSK